MEYTNKENENYHNIEINNEKPTNFEYFKTISKDLFGELYYDNKACIFSSHCNDCIFIVYGNNTLDLECYNIEKERNFILIKKLHKNKFYSCRYYYNEKENKDLIITSSFDNHVKIINFYIEKAKFYTSIIIDFNFEEMEEQNYFINTAYFINPTIIAIPFSNNRKMIGMIQFYDSNKEILKEIKDTGFIMHVNKYYWKEKNKYYCFICNMNDILVYDLEYFNLYHKFNSVNEEVKGFGEPYIIEKENKLILIGSDFHYGNIFFWNFETKKFISKMRLTSGISGYSIWDNKYIFASLNANKNDFFLHSFVLINIDKKIIEKKFYIENNDSFCDGIKVFRHESKGDFLITTNLSGQLHLFIIKD